MKNFFKRFPETGVLVIGDLMIDHYIWGKVNRISPEAPVPVVEVLEENLILGGAANVAHNILSLGGKVFVTGVIGRDDMGRILIHKLREKGINTDGIIVEKDRPTTVKTRIIAHSQQVVRFDRETKSDISQSTLSLILEYVKKSLPEIKAIIISDYCKGTITKALVKEIIKIADSKVFVAADPKIGHFDYYKRVGLITPNIAEASSGSGINIIDEETLVTAGKTLLKRLRCKAILITKGEKGMSLFESTGKITHIPTFAREVYDVTGAGDAVVATFTLCHSAGAKLKDAAIYANHAAGAVVGKIGTAVTTPEDIITSINMNNPHGKAKTKYFLKRRNQQ